MRQRERSLHLHRSGEVVAQTPDPRYEALNDRYGAQVVPASKIRMLECVTCRRTFFDFEGRMPHKPPGNHSKCGKALRWVWVE
jgi:hypothetical protein